MDRARLVKCPTLPADLLLLILLSLLPTLAAELLIEHLHAPPDWSLKSSGHRHPHFLAPIEKIHLGPRLRILVTLSTLLLNRRHPVCRQQILIVGSRSLECLGTHLRPRQTPPRGGRLRLPSQTNEHIRSRRLILEYVPIRMIRSYIARAPMGFLSLLFCYSTLQLIC